jgi:hypothetical protein
MSRYWAGQHESRGVPDIGADEISFLIETHGSRRAVPPIGARWGCAIARAVTRN